MMKLITEELLDTVTSQAKENSRLRMNYNFHASMDAPVSYTHLTLPTKLEV